MTIDHSAVSLCFFLCSESRFLPVYPFNSFMNDLQCLVVVYINVLQFIR